MSFFLRKSSKQSKLREDIDWKSIIKANEAANRAASVDEQWIICRQRKRDLIDSMIHISRLEDSLKEYVHNVAHVLQTMTDELNCIICQELPSEMTVLQCSHLFCNPCIRKWIESGNQESVTCPICRKHIHFNIDIPWADNLNRLLLTTAEIHDQINTKFEMTLAEAVDWSDEIIPGLDRLEVKLPGTLVNLMRSRCLVSESLGGMISCSSPQKLQPQHENKGIQAKLETQDRGEPEQAEDMTGALERKEEEKLLAAINSKTFSTDELSSDHGKASSSEELPHHHSNAGSCDKDVLNIIDSSEPSNECTSAESVQSDSHRNNSSISKKTAEQIRLSHIRLAWLHICYYETLKNMEIDGNIPEHSMCSKACREDTSIDDYIPSLPLQMSDTERQTAYRLRLAWLNDRLDEEYRKGTLANTGLEKLQIQAHKDTQQLQEATCDILGTTAQTPDIQADRNTTNMGNMRIPSSYHHLIDNNGDAQSLKGKYFNQEKDNDINSTNTNNSAVNVAQSSANIHQTILPG